MSNVLSLYVPGTSRYHGLNPLTKLTISVSLIFFGFLAPWTYTSYGVFFLVVFPLSVIAGVWRHILTKTLRITLPFAISIFIIQGFFWGSGDTLFTIGPLSYKYEGFLFGISSVGNIILVVSSFLLLSLTTRPDALMLSLAQLGMPTGITYIVVTTIQIAPYFQRRAEKILDAQRSRGLETEGNLLVRARAFLPLAMPLILSSLLDVEERAMAIEARGFNSKSKKTSLLELDDSKWQKILRWGLVIIVLLTLMVNLWLL